jgi:hypothetical protein
MNMFASDAPTVFAPPMTTPTQTPKPSNGMFGGGKFGWKEALMGALAGFMARRNPAAVQGLMAMMQSKQSAQREEEQYQRRRGDSLEDWKAQQQFKIDHPEAVNNDTVADYNFRVQTLGKDAADEWLRNQGDPIVTVQLPGNRVYSGPRSQLGGALGSPAPSIKPGHVEGGFRFKGGNPADPNAWEPENGGPTPQASGMFP